QEYPVSACCRIGHARECGCTLCQWIRRHYEMEARIAALEQENARLREALKPFGDAGYKAKYSSYPDDWPLVTEPRVTVGDRRRAARALRAAGRETQPRTP